MYRKELALITIVCVSWICNLQGEDIYGDLYNGLGEIFVVDGPDFFVYGSIQNFGTMYIVDTLWAEYEFQNSGLIEVLGDKCSGVQNLKNDAPGVVKGYGLIASKNGCIDNKGLIWSMGGSLLLYSGDSKKVSISNTGTLRNSPGTSITVRVLVPSVNNQGSIEINADGAVVFDCNNLNNEPNAIIKLYGGTLAVNTVTQKAGAILEGFGGITGDFIIDPNALVKLTGPTNIVGDVNIAENAVLEIRDGTVLITGHTACNGKIRIKGGRIVPQGGLSGDCNVISVPSDYNNLENLAFLADTWLWQID